MANSTLLIQVLNNNSLITYSSTWSSISNDNDIFQVGNMGSPSSSLLRFTNNGTLFFNFTGSTISVFVSYISSATIATQTAESENSLNLNVLCKVDGMTIDTFIPVSPQNNWPLCSNGDLSNGQHTLMVDVPYLAGLSIYFDYFLIDYSYHDLSEALAPLGISVPSSSFLSFIPDTSSAPISPTFATPYQPRKAVTTILQPLTVKLTSFNLTSTTFAPASTKLSTMRSYDGRGLSDSQPTQPDSASPTPTPLPAATPLPPAITTSPPNFTSSSSSTFDSTSSSLTDSDFTSSTTDFLPPSAPIAPLSTTVVTARNQTSKILSTVLQSSSSSSPISTTSISAPTIIPVRRSDDHGVLIGSIIGASTFLVAIIFFLVWYRKHHLKKKKKPLAILPDATFTQSNSAQELLVYVNENSPNNQSPTRTRQSVSIPDHYSYSRLSASETLVDTPQSDRRRQPYPSLEIPSLPVTLFEKGAETLHAAENEEPQNFLEDVHSTTGRPLPIPPESYIDSGVRLVERGTLSYEGAGSEAGSMLTFKERLPPLYTRN